MARTLTAEEFASLSPDERSRRQRIRAQRERESVTVHEVAEENLTVKLNGAVVVLGRGSATPQEIASALNRFPQLAKMIRAAQGEGE